ncbi:MAG: hypothetical protein RhofKO_00860 [Rhodothermales bacterium]
MLLSGKRAYEVRAYEKAVRSFAKVGEQSSRYPEAQYWLARSYVNVDPPKLQDAAQAARKAYDAQPDNEDYRILHQLLSGEGGMGALPTYKQQRLEAIARRVLQHDSLNGAAYQVMGSRYLRDYTYVHGSITLAEDEDVERLMLLDAQPDGASNTSFQLGATTSERIFGTSRERQAQKSYLKAYDYLLKAAEVAPVMRSTYAELMRLIAMAGRYGDAAPLLDRMAIPYDSTGEYWLYRGLVAVETERYEEAEHAFAQAKQRLDETEWQAFNNPAAFDDAEESEAVALYWSTQDPRFLTPYNERLLIHYARLVYADLRFGDAFTAYRGWETEPGQVLVRYGRPVVETNVQSPLDRFLHFHYDDVLLFKFMDMAKAGKPVFYSPSAGAFSGRPQFDMWNADHVLRSRELFTRYPDRIETDKLKSMPFPYLVNRLRGADGNVELWVPVGVGVNVAQPTPKEGVVTLVDAAQGIVEQAFKRAPLDPNSPRHSYQEGALSVDTYRLSAAPGTYEMAVEFEVQGVDTLAAFDRGPIQLPDYSSRELTASDLVLAYLVEEGDAAQTAPGMVERQGYHLDLAPWGVFTIGQPLYLYFELYGLGLNPQGEGRYEVEAVIEKRDERRRLFSRKKDSAVSVRTQQRIMTADVGDFLILDTSDQAPGLYTVRVVVRDRESGQQVDMERQVRLE